VRIELVNLLGLLLAISLMLSQSVLEILNVLFALVTCYHALREALRKLGNTLLLLNDGSSQGLAHSCEFSGLLLYALKLIFNLNYFFVFYSDLTHKCLLASIHLLNVLNGLELHSLDLLDSPLLKLFAVGLTHAEHLFDTLVAFLLHLGFFLHKPDCTVLLFLEIFLQFLIFFNLFIQFLHLLLVLG